MNLCERKSKILSAIIDIFVSTGEPVGSKALCDFLDFSVSSATIRNEMAELSELGLLTQPHASAGRVPSHLGYRFYINNLMNKNTISENEKNIIDSLLSSSADSVEHLIKDASQTLAHLTKFASVLTGVCSTNATIARIEFVQTGKRSAMLILMISNGVIKNKIFRCDYDITNEILRIFFRIINEKFVGIKVSEITPAFIQSVGASLGEMTLLMPSVLMAVLEAADDACSAEINLNGEMNLMFLPDFELNKAKNIITFLNRQKDLKRFLFNNQKTSVNVLIGEETNVPELRDSSTIIARYTLNKNDTGIIAIIGSTRMDYAKVISNLEYFSYKLECLLNGLLDTSK